jgi:hypothetical protein
MPIHSKISKIGETNAREASSRMMKFNASVGHHLATSLAVVQLPATTASFPATTDLLPY